MLHSIAWFCILLAVALVGTLIGRRLALRSESAARSLVALATFGVALAAIPRFQPTVLHSVLPLDITIWLEGTLAAFPFMLLVGALSAATFADRVKRTAPLMFVLGLVYYCFGALWMVLPPIDLAGNEVGRDDAGVFLQTRPDTCAAASCATALGLMNITTTEQEMIEIVQAKPSRGSTLGRVALGLSDFLAPQYRVEVRNLSPVEVAQQARPDRPILVIVKSGVGADHMIAVLGHNPLGVVVANPSPGVHAGVSPLPIKLALRAGNEIYQPEDFVRLVRPGAIVFEPVG
ncbi:MAG: hypothetical protein AAF432_05025 [Planctomycetota bacterium]